jgi:hypothetical protein
MTETQDDQCRATIIDFDRTSAPLQLPSTENTPTHVKCQI